MRLSSLVAGSAFLALAILPAAATSTKTWVSSTGTDTGVCPLTAPCRTFQYAHDQTTSGGEIDVKDSGSYGPVAVTKSISIVAEGVLASVGGATNTVAVNVNIGGGDVVVLRGLNLDGHRAGGNNGLQTGTNGVIIIDKCIVRNFNYGIYSVGGFGSLVATNNLITGNTIGVKNVAATALLGNDTIAGNATGVDDTNGAEILSYGDNNINDNTNDLSGTLGSLAKR